MTALIILENHFIKDKNGNVWCDRVVDYSYLNRYLSVFDEIVVCGRFSLSIDDCSSKLLVSGKNVSFIEIPDFKGAKGLLKNIFKIRKIISKSIKSIDCCIMRAPTHLSFVAYKLLLKNKIPFAIEFMMAADKMVEGNGVISKIINSLLVWEAKKMCKLANGVSYVTEYKLQQIYPCSAVLKKSDKMYFTSSYSSIDLTDDMIYEQKWKKNNKPTKFKIVHTGYMDSYRKGQDVLLKAIKNVIDRGYKNIELILIGDGDKRKEFEKLTKELEIEKYVDFKGLIKSKDEIISILKACHIFVFPTHSEGLPRSLIEAMAVGLVCIASPVDGIPELLNEDNMIDYNDYVGYSNKIIEYIENWPAMIEVSKKNNRIVEKYKKNNLDQKRKEYYNHLKKIVSKNNN